jgi:hypothetical protein
MERFARVVIGYHGCPGKFARGLLLGETSIDDWEPSQNEWDWLGHGIYFWEHSPERALRWARQQYTGRRSRPSVVGAVVQLGRCFDLLDESITSVLAESHAELARSFARAAQSLPVNHGQDAKRRNLDCLVINDCLRQLKDRGVEYDTVRGAFLEGEPVYPGAGFARETHIQLAVRNSACILGVFRPNLKV